MLKSSLYNQSHFFKIKVKESAVLNFSFFIMNHLRMYAWSGREGGYVPKCTAAYLQGAEWEVKKFDILHM